MKTKSMLALISALALGMLGCNAGQANQPRPGHNNNPYPAYAELVSAPGHDIQGVVVFHELPRGVHIEATVQGLAPGAHGIHIHEIGECALPDFTSAGDHFNPDNRPHGPPGQQSHAGDLGNIIADAQGRATLSLVAPDISLDPQSRSSIIGLALIIHEDPDDLVSQPSGDAGGRIACGIIVEARAQDGR